MRNTYTELLSHINSLKRYKWRVTAVAVLLSLFGWGIILALPNKYTSSARVYVDTSSLLAPLLKGIAVQTDLQSEVRIMQKTLFSRPNLAKIVEMNDLALEADDSRKMEALLTNVKLRSTIRSHGKNLFSISYVSGNPVKARDVVQSYLTVFVEKNLGKNREEMQNAQSFIEGQIRQYEISLKQAEERLARFEVENIEIVAGGNFSAQWQAARGHLEKTQAEIADTNALIRRLEKQLARTPAYYEMTTQTQVNVHAPGKGGNSLEDRVGTLERKLDEMLLVYTEEHPDVQALRRQLVPLQAKLKEEQKQGKSAGNGVSRVPNSLHEQLNLRLIDAQAMLDSLKREEIRALEEVDRLSALRGRAPEVEAKMKDLNRDYGIIKSKYEDLLARREAARISEAQETTTDSIQFRIVEPPEIPAFPSSPKRLILILAVSVVSIGAGVGLVILVSMIGGGFSASEQLKSATGIQVLGEVSLSHSGEKKAAIRKGYYLWAIVVAGYFLLLGATMFVAMKYNELLSPHTDSLFGHVVSRLHDALGF